MFSIKTFVSGRRAANLLEQSLSYKASRTKQQGAESVSSTTATLQDVASVDDFLNAAATETVPLFEHLEFEFLLEYDVFAPASRGRTRVHQPPDLFRGFLHSTTRMSTVHAR